MKTISVLFVAIIAAATADAAFSDCGQRFISDRNEASPERATGDGVEEDRSGSTQKHTFIAGPKELPWMVSIQEYGVRDKVTKYIDYMTADQVERFWQGQSPQQVAGTSELERVHRLNGAVISSCWVLTTTTLLSESAGGHQLLVAAGSNVFHNNKGARTDFEYRINRIVIYPVEKLVGTLVGIAYSDVTVLGLIQICGTFNEKFVAPICLPPATEVMPLNHYPPVDRQCLVAAWGLKDPPRKIYFPDKLSYTSEVYLLEQDKCRVRDRNLAERLVCAYGYRSPLCGDGDANILACRRDGRYYLVGHQNQAFCPFDAYAAEFFKVAFYRSWIDEVLGVKVTETA